MGEVWGDSLEWEQFGHLLLSSGEVSDSTYLRLTLK